MRELLSAIPDVQMLLALTPEELASKMLFLLRKRGEEKFHLGNLDNELWACSGQKQYPRQHEREISLAIAEAWAWLQAQGLVVPAGQHGWLRLSRRARSMESEADFTDFKVGRLLQRGILHSCVPPLRQRAVRLPT